MKSCPMRCASLIDARVWSAQVVPTVVACAGLAVGDGLTVGEGVAGEGVAGDGVGSEVGESVAVGVAVGDGWLADAVASMLAGAPATQAERRTTASTSVRPRVPVRIAVSVLIAV